MMDLRLMFALSCMAGMAGCEAKPPLRQADEYLSLRAPADLEICAGTFTKASREVELIRSEFAPSTGPVEFEWLPSSHYPDSDFPCAVSDYACASGTSVYSRAAVSTHELVHAARTPGLPELLEEGLATMLDEPTLFESELASREELEAALFDDSWQLSHGFYERAAHFVSFLVARSGREKLAELEHHFGPSQAEAYLANRATMEAALAEVYGSSLAELVVEYEDYPDCAPAQFHHPISVCHALTTSSPVAVLRPRFGTDTEQSAYRRSVDCASEEVYGPIARFDHTSRAVSVAIELESPLAQPVRASLEGSSSEASLAWLTNCGDCWSGSAVLASGDAIAFASLQPGLHVLTLHQDVEESGELGIELSY